MLEQFLQLTILGLIQGLTEFLPISSSGHLVLVGRIVGLGASASLHTTIWLHMGTLAATCLVYRSELWRMVRADWRLMAGVLLAMVPAAVVGTQFGSYFDRLFAAPRLSVQVTAAMLIATGLAMTVGERISNRWSEQATRVTWWQALAIGFAQALAILPGSSRSGMTIAAGLIGGLQRRAAADFSFLLSVPTVGGAVLVDAAGLLQDSGSLASTSAVPPAAILLGTTVSFVTGLVALKWFLHVLRRWPLYTFASYCCALGALILLLELGG